MASKTEHKVIYFHDEIDVEKVSTESAQAKVFFGRDTHMGVRVVLKQYKGSSFKGIFRELKIFTYIEQTKKMQKGVDLE